MPKKKLKILVAMSGGVDSSVAAALLVKAGFDVTGMFAVNYDDTSQEKSCWHGDYHDALRVAAKLGIPLLRWDFRKEYKRDVLDYMYREYRAGRTPNPDVLCNKFVKFGAWLKKARALGFDFLATGHYARVECHPERSEGSKTFSCKLKVACDVNKDQTYFLHQLSQMQLKYTMFPIGKYTKPQVRILAKKFNLPTAVKEESMGICFVGEVPMKEFLQKKIKSKPGKIISTKGDVLGKHNGLPFYTIGERVGVSQHCHSEEAKRPKNLPNNTQPFYVVDKNLKKNELVVGENNDPALLKKEIIIKDVHWISGQVPKFPLKCLVRLRHRQELQNCHCDPPGAGNNLRVKFSTPQRAVTPGQFAVFYLPRRSSSGAKAGGVHQSCVGAKADKNNECLGGGVIK